MGEIIKVMIFKIKSNHCEKIDLDDQNQIIVEKIYFDNQNRIEIKIEIIY